MLLLGVDTSSQASTAALFEDGALVCEYTQNQNKTHSVKMLPMIEEMLADVNVSVSDIDVFACGIGPGSFTGVRIGVATVRGFAKTMDKPCVAVNSLETLAKNAAHFPGTVFALVFARENECYCAAFENGDEILAPCVLTVEEIAEQAKGKTVLFLGDGAVINAEKLNQLVPTGTVAAGRQNIVSAAALCEVAQSKIAAGATGTCESLIPLYLRKSQAEREYEEKQKTKKEEETK